MQTALATPTDRARTVPASPPFADLVIQALRDLGGVATSPRARTRNGELCLLAEQRRTGAVVVSVLQSAAFSVDRDVIEAAESSLARRGFRVRFRLPQKHVRGAHEELLVLPAVRGSR